MKAVLLTLLQVPVFLLVLVTYLVVLKSVHQLPFFLIGLLLNQWAKWTAKSVTPHAYAVLTRVECLSGLFCIVLFSWVYFHWNLWQADWLKVWCNPLLVVVLLFMSVHVVGHLMGYNPVLRSFAVGALWPAWAVIILVFLAAIFSSAVKQATFKWGVLASAAVLFLGTIWQLWHLPTNIEHFEEIDARHNKLGASLKRLQWVANILGDSVQWRTIKDAISNADECHSRALESLRRNQLAEANNILLQAEAEIAGIDRTLQDRIQLSLRDELQGKLEQAAKDCETLRNEFGQIRLNPSGLDGLGAKIESLLSNLASLDPLAADVFERLAPYDSLFREVVNTRTALRFRRNVGSVLDTVHDDIHRFRMHIELSEKLGIDTKVAADSLQKVVATLDAFPKSSVSSSSDLVDIYQRFQKQLGHLRAAVNALIAATNSSHQIRTLDSDHISIFVPKYCTTTAPTYGAILVAPGSSLKQSLTCVVDGVLFELPSNPTLSIPPVTEGLYQMRRISLVGKRAKRGSLTFTIKDPAKFQGEFSFEIKIKPSVVQTARDAMVFGTPAAGLAVWFLWYLWKDIKVSAPLGVAFGGVVGLFIFLVQRLKAEKG